MILALLLAGAASQAAAVTPEQFEDVQVGAVVLRVPFADGYCKPTGPDIAAFQALAAGDNKNVTLLSLVGCGPHGKSRSYVLFKTPVAALNAVIDRDTALIELANAVDKLPMSAILDDAGKSKSEASGQATHVDGAVSPKGHDDACVYMGGIINTSIGEEKHTQSLGTCMTVVGNRLIALNAYEDSKDPDAYVAMLPKIREWVLRIVPRP